MPMLEKYRHYFDIDPDYFPAVNEAVIMKNPDMWKKFFPHETFIKLVKNTVSVLERKQKLCLWVEGAALRGDLYRAANEIDELKNKLAELHETKTEQPAEQKPEPKTAAEIIAARWAEVDGLTATIKGATTAAPVVWLAGDTKPHEKEIEAAGGKWSGKKNAYYFRVA